MSELNKNTGGGSVASDNSELLACPFCGSNKVQQGKETNFMSNAVYGSRAGCNKCGALGRPIKEVKLVDGFKYDNHTESNQAWNSRAG